MGARYATHHFQCRSDLHSWCWPCFAQVNTSIGGIVEDASDALIPGVTITATNTQTGVVSTTVTNESGAYNFPAILPGIYKLTASLPGFKPVTYNEVNLSRQVRSD